MVTAQAQRTLVKSPPELWSELSDPESLARHLSRLGELGEIRIIRCKAEESVEWEAEQAKGIVEMKPSGWGTRVTLSVTVSAPPVEEADAEPGGPKKADEADQRVESPSAAAGDERRAGASTDGVAGANAKTTPVHAGIGTDAAEATDTRSEALDGAAPKIDAVTPPRAAEPQATSPPRHSRLGGLLARLRARAAASPLRRNRRAQHPLDGLAAAVADAPPPELVGTEPDEPPLGDAEVAVPATSGEAASEADGDASAGANADAADAADASATSARHLAATTELLVAVLDRLGEAHHRPFSRA